MKLVQLNYLNGETFITQLRKLCKEQDITLCAVNKRKRKLKKKDRYNKHARAIHSLFESSKDGIWRPHNHHDTTCTNICQLGGVYYRLGLLIDLSTTSAVNKVKWNWSLVRAYKKRKEYTAFSLDKKSLDKKFFPKLKKILVSMNLEIDKIECDTIGGSDKTVFIEAVVADKDVLAKDKLETEERNKRLDQELQDFKERERLENEQVQIAARHPETLEGHIQLIDDAWESHSQFSLKDKVEVLTSILEECCKDKFDREKVKIILENHFREPKAA